LMSGVVVFAIAAQALGMFGGGAPTVLTPRPIVLVVPIFRGVPGFGAVTLFLLIFWTWQPSLFSGVSKIPVRSLVLVGLTTVLSIAWFIGWSFGVKYQGGGYTLLCALLSAIFMFGTILIAWRGRKAPSFLGSLSFDTVLFGWLATYALPYLGEMP
jgi:hypothetical protein